MAAVVTSRYGDGLNLMDGCNWQHHEWLQRRAEHFGGMAVVDSAESESMYSVNLPGA